MVPVLLFAAAGALMGAGAGGGYFAWQKASQQAAHELSHDDIKNVEDLLRDAANLGDVRRKAEEAGINVEAVVAGYAAMRDKHVDIADVMLRFAEGRVAAPVDDPHPVSGAGSSYEVVSTAYIRRWARVNGYEVAQTGRLSNDVLAAYHSAHEHPEGAPLNG